MTGSQRRAANREARRLEAERQEAEREQAERTQAASKIQTAFRAHLARKAARKELQQTMKGEAPERLMKIVGEHYTSPALGLVRPTEDKVEKASGRLAGSWSGGVKTQKDRLEQARAAGTLNHDPIGTTHHTVSDHILGYVHEGVERVAGQDGGQQAQAFRTKVAEDSLYSPQGAPPADANEKSLFQMRSNLTYGPLTETITNDPGSGFDPVFDKSNSEHLERDWDERSRRLRPLHNLGMLLKSGKYELTPKGVEHMTSQLDKARVAHEAMVQGKRYPLPSTTVKVPNPAWNPKKPAKGVKKTISQEVPQSADQTIPVHGLLSDHFKAEANSKVSKKKFKDA